jgi:large subunit ribosomal protein L54
MLPSTSSASRPAKSKESKTQKLVGSIPGGTPLYGLGYLKGKPTILAKEDDEYPDWLWTLLDAETGAKTSDGKSSDDVAGKQFSPAMRMRLFPGRGPRFPSSDLVVLALPKAARERYMKKQEKLLKSLPKKIPLHEQSKDLTQPGDSAELSAQRRQELVRSSRDARRKGIKENNFLRGM